MTTAELNSVSPDTIRTHINCASGSENWYRHSSGMLYTDGINQFAELAECFWLIDAIASWQRAVARRVGEMASFQVWELIMQPAGSRFSAILTCRMDADEPVVVSQSIEYTDFPLPEGVKLYVSGGTLLLPGEY